MSHWFDEYAKGVAEGQPWAKVLRRVGYTLRAERETPEEGSRIPRRAALAGLVGTAVVALIDRLAPSAAADGARARQVAKKECQNHEDTKKGLVRAPATDPFEGVACSTLEAQKIVAAKHCTRICRPGECPEGETCTPIGMGGIPAYKNECGLVNSALNCPGNPGNKAYACWYKTITQCTCLCKKLG